MDGVRKKGSIFFSTFSKVAKLLSLLFRSSWHGGVGMSAHQCTESNHSLRIHYAETVLWSFPCIPPHNVWIKMQGKRLTQYWLVINTNNTGAGWSFLMSLIKSNTHPVRQHGQNPHDKRTWSGQPMSTSGHAVPDSVLPKNHEPSLGQNLKHMYTIQPTHHRSAPFLTLPSSANISRYTAWLSLLVLISRMPALLACLLSARSEFKGNTESHSSKFKNCYFNSCITSWDTPVVISTSMSGPNMVSLNPRAFVVIWKKIVG